jgi:hypothetical protein
LNRLGCYQKVLPFSQSVKRSSWVLQKNSWLKLTKKENWLIPTRARTLFQSTN